MPNANQTDNNQNGIGDICEGYDQGSGEITIVGTTLEDYYRYVGDKRYELSNHLGNVLSVVTDRKLIKVDGNGAPLSTTLFPDVLSYSDYYPFGMLVPNRHASSNSYRYGFQGQEKDDEIKGEGNSLNYTFRMHDPRVGRFFAIDPLFRQYPYNSTYAFAENMPIAFIDLEGSERYYAADGSYLGKYGTSDQIRVVTNKDLKWAKDYIAGRKTGEWDQDIMDFYMSIPFHMANEASQSKISESIFKNNIRTPNSLESIEMGKGDSGTAARTFGPGKFQMYPQVTNAIKGQTESLMDNYYNQINTLYHEEQHSLAFSRGDLDGGNDAFEHFKIGKLQVLHSSYKSTTVTFKDYVRDVMLGYLQSQQAHLGSEIALSNDREETYKSYSFQYYMKEYQKNVKFFNKTFGENYKELDFKEMIRSLEEDLKSKK